MNRDTRLYNFFLEVKKDKIESFDNLNEIDISFNTDLKKNVLVGGYIKQHDNKTFNESCKKHIKNKNRSKYRDFKNISMFGFNFTKL